jgi:peptidoglycan hydrolase CwlO-like protein
VGGGRDRGARPARRRLLAAAALAVVLAAPATPATAETPEEAHAAARRAATALADVQAEVDTALRDYDRAMSGMARGVSHQVDAEREAAAARAALDAHEDVAADQARAVYMSGGAPVLYGSLLDADDTRDLMRRATVVRRVMAAGADDVDDATRVTARARTRADALAATLDRRVVTAAEVVDRRAALDAALRRQQEALARLAARASRLEAARDSRLATARAARAAAERAAALEETRVAAVRHLREARAATVETTTTHVTTARASGVPADYLALYRGAAATCPGLSWTVLAALGQVESGHGVNTGPSSAGAQGPMQFMPATFAAYGVDGDGDGDTEIDDPADSVYSAAHYVCSTGGGRGGEALWQALWHYNHADWYVEMVLRIAGQLAGG